ncbi:MAG: hypothetical protein M3384_14570 [Acidobacteriota bacterium]|nr:hypothetical protein [Acidobacteriota bacterium]
MNDNFNRRNAGKYIFPLLVTVGLNLLLISFLLKVSFSQEVYSNTNQKKQPLKVSVENQPDSPLIITVISVNDSISSRPIVGYAVQNVSEKAISAFTIVEKERTTTQETITGTTISYSTLLLQPKDYNRDSFNARQFYQVIEELTLFVDYVEFGDGTSWGNDTQKGSETIAGRRAGRIKAIEEINNLIRNQNINSVISLINQEITQIIVPAADSKQTEKWRNGFQLGYKSVVAQAKSAYDKQGVEAVLTKLKEIENLIRKESK